MSDYPVHNPHDRYFKAALGFHDTARKLLAVILPQDILAIVDLDRVRIEPGSFVDPPMRDRHTDALFMLPLRDGGGEIGVLTIVEHFSDPDMDTPFRFAGYIWRAHGDRRERGLPPVPIVGSVFYHGEKPWTAPMDMRDWQNAQASIAHRVMCLPYTLYSLRDIADEDLPEDPFLRSLAFSMKYIRSPRLHELLPQIIGWLKQAGGVDFLHVQVWYLLAALQEEDALLEVTQQVFGEKGSDVVISAADKLRREGWLAGELKGRATEARQLVLRQLAKRIGFVSSSDQEELGQLPLEKLEALADDLLDFRESADLTRWLAEH